jgi:hypothetical protein
LTYLLEVLEHLIPVHTGVAKGFPSIEVALVTSREHHLIDKTATANASASWK